jgi:hypothetical protein
MWQRKGKDGRNRSGAARAVKPVIEALERRLHLTASVMPSPSTSSSSTFRCF